MSDGDYVHSDEHDVLRVAQTRVMLDSVIAGFKQGFSAEAIQQQYPAMTLEEVYGAIAYYLKHRAAVDEYLEQQDEVWRQSRSESDKDVPDVVQRLRSHSASTSSQP